MPSLVVWVRGKVNKTRVFALITVCVPLTSTGVKLGCSIQKKIDHLLYIHVHTVGPLYRGHLGDMLILNWYTIRYTEKV